jgi:pyrimidine operon attenuation protein/uracil phosphoribosyltransferase
VEATFIGRKVQTTAQEVIEVKLTEIDDAEKVLLMER